MRQEERPQEAFHYQSFSVVKKFLSDFLRSLLFIGHTRNFQIDARHLRVSSRNIFSFYRVRMETFYYWVSMKV